jgi:hypothetical protein
MHTRHVAFSGLLPGILRILHPKQANRRPALFILEIAAALLSVLTLRNEILGGRAILPEICVAVGLWGTLLAIACGLTFQRPAARIPYRGRPTKSSRG